MNSLTRASCQALDERDCLSSFRDEFVLDDTVIYLDGNSLGALPRTVPGRLREVVLREWGQGLIRSWNAAGWMEAPTRIGGKIARLIGADRDEVIATDSTSVNLFKLMVAALRLRPGRPVILSETGNFPTDLYLAEGVAGLFGDRQLRLVPADAIGFSIDADVALVTLTHVDFRSGRLHDMERITAEAHAAGALILWDLSHSAGAMPIELAGAAVDLAVGCGYKYLNGGPGAPAFMFVARRLQSALRQPITGWMGHAAPFEFAPDYTPAAGIARTLSGTPPVLSMAALETALDMWERVDLAAVRRKAARLGDLFIRLVEARCSGFRLASPRQASERGSQVSFHHPQGYAIMQALIRRGVIGDFRAPDLLRFGFAPLYIRYVDVWDAVEHLAAVMAGGEWDRPELKARARVT
jgi:kynureninase